MHSLIRRHGRALVRLACMGLASGIAVATPPAAAEPRVSVLPLEVGITQFRAPASRVAAVVATGDALRQEKALLGRPLVVVWGRGGGAAIALDGTELRLFPLGAAVADLEAVETARDALPGSRQQAAGPLRVFLSDRTGEYVHGVFGQPFEAKALTIVERRPVQPGSGPVRVPTEITRVEAGDGAVFEDREPRIAELDPGGSPQILVVRSTHERGAALAVVGRADGRWRILAESGAAGAPQRWLNPAGVAAFSGNGQEIALVQRPHLDGLLQVWAWEAGKLVLRHQAAGYSNHVFGTTALDLSAAIELGQGPPKLAIPTLDRSALAILSLAGGITEVARIPLPAKASTGVAALGSGAALHILVGLEDGRVADVRP